MCVGSESLRKYKCLIIYVRSDGDGGGGGGGEGE